jgi:acetoin utilization deacetylase AcuC-like enzyme
VGKALKTITKGALKWQNVKWYPDLGLYLLVMVIWLHLVNVGEDCPVFDGMYEFCQLSAGGSIGTCFTCPTS